MNAAEHSSLVFLLDSIIKVPNKAKDLLKLAYLLAIKYESSADYLCKLYFLSKIEKNLIEACVKLKNSIK